jgi:N-acyl-D-amino-acid deacylase
MRRLLAEPASRTRIRQEIQSRRPSDPRQFDPEAIMIGSLLAGDANHIEGRSLAELSRADERDALEIAFDLLASHGGAVQMIFFSMAEDDVQMVMRHPAVAIASDGWTLHPSAGGKPHPRSYGTYARVLGKYVREEGVLALEEAIRKMTSLPAGRLRRTELGRIAVGCSADLVVFDPERISERATFDDPHEYAEGVTHVIVNGRVVIDDCEDTPGPPWQGGVRLQRRISAGRSPGHAVVTHREQKRDMRTREDPQVPIAQGQFEATDWQQLT